jgi:membrane-associated protein
MNPLDAHDIVTTLGIIGVLAALFIETGLLVGLLLPGDSLLFIAGLAASEISQNTFGDQLSYVQLIICAPIAAIAGSQFGHWLGATYGRPFFDRPDSRFFNQARVLQTERWLVKYGLGKALILSHFIPFIRTLLNPLCGIVGIPAKKFFFWNVIGSYIWTTGMISAGYMIGQSFESSLSRYLMPIILFIVLLSLIPLILEILRNRRVGS